MYILCRDGRSMGLYSNDVEKAWGKLKEIVSKYHKPEADMRVGYNEPAHNAELWIGTKVVNIFSIDWAQEIK